MKQTSTNTGGAFKKYLVIILTVFGFSFSQFAFADGGEPYTCNGGRVTNLYFNELNGGADLPINNGSTFTVAQLGSLYNLEAGTSGTIGSVKYTITGPTATSNIENSTPYNSPGTGSGAWTGAVGNYSVNLKTYSGADGTGSLCHDTTITFILSNTTYNCNCPGNIILNPGFESGITNWSSSGGTLAQGNGGVACGTYSGDLNNTSSTSKAWQNIGTNLATGTVVNVSVYAGTHDNSFNNFVAVEFLNSSNAVLSSSVYVQVDKVLANNPAGPQLYTFTATVPSGTTTTRVAFGGNGSYTKTDQWCVTTTPISNCLLGGINLGTISNYLFVFTNGSTDANWQSASKGFVGNVAVDGIQASERTSGSFAYAGTIFSNDASLNAWASIVSNNATQASSSLNQTARLSGLETELNNVFTQINALPVTSGYNGIDPITLNGLNRQNSIAETFVINVNSGFNISSQINITGDANDVFILRWDTDMNFSNGYQGQVKFQSGGAIVPLGGLKPSNFLHVAGDIGSSGGGANPPAPYPQGPRTNNGTGSLITGGADFSGGGFFTGYWFTTGDPVTNETSSLSNGIFVGGWYSKTTKFSMTSGTSGVYVAPVCTPPASCTPPPATLCGPPATFTHTSIASGGWTSASTWQGGVVPSVENISNQKIKITHDVTVPNNNIKLDNSTIIYITNGGRLTLMNGNLELMDGNQATTEKLLIVNGALRTSGNVQQSGSATVVCAINSKLEIGDEDARSTPSAFTSGFFSSSNNYTSADFQNTTGYRRLESSCLNVTHDLQNDGGTDIFINVCAEIGDQGPISGPHGNNGGFDGQDNGNIQIQSTFGTNSKYYDSEIYIPNGSLQNSRDFLTCNVDYRLTNGNYQNQSGGTLTGTANVIYINHPSNGVIQNAGSWNWSTIEKWRTDNTSSPTGLSGTTVTESTQASILAEFGTCNCAVSTLTLGNRVWYDTNNNGINEAAENGIRNVTVNLYRDDNNDNVADGASIASVLTDVNGNYTFSNLASGNYIVGVVIPNGYMSSSINGGDPDNNTDLDDNGQVLVANEIRGLAITLTVGGEPTGGNTNNTYDFGLLPDCACVNSTSNLLVNPSFENGTTGWSWSSGTLTTGTGYVACGTKNGFNNWSSGTSKVWQDVTVSAGSTVSFSAFAGTHAPGIACSPKLSLVFLNSANATISQSDVTVTRVVGDYNDQLEQYSITAVAPAGTVKVRVQSTITCNTMKLDAFCLTVTVPNGSIGDRVWNDTDADGIQDAGEVGVAGVTLVLLNSAGQPIATTTTDAFGNYKFSGLPAGNYSVRVTPPANYSLSPKTQGGDTNLDSDFDPINYTTGTVTLAPGQNRTDIDAGLKFNQPQPASVGDRVWLDTNGDGVQDAGEPGVSNVLVTLYNSAGTAVRFTYTDVNGNYLFTDVTPGTYTVGFSLPPAFVFSPNTGAVSVANNSDAIPATGRTASFTVNAGDQIRYVDAGLRSQVSTNGSIGDYVWNDLDKDGVQEAGEPGIAGVTVRLINAVTNAVVATTTTDVTGKYIFNDLPAGDYKVEFVTPAGYTTTTRLSFNPQGSNTDSDVDPATSRTATFTLNAGQRITTVDAGYWLTTGGTGKIGDRVWLDADQNGIQDAGEANVQGVTVTLYDAANTAIKTTVTDANGNYLFTDLSAGSYTVGFSNIPQGFTFTTQGLGTAATGSDANPATGRTATIVLAAGETNLNVDAGIRSMMAGTASLGNRVWNDLNNNGLQDAGEPGIQGVTVELLDAAGNPIDSDPSTAGVQPTTRVTNALGEYLFTGLAGGDYRVRFGTLPAGYNASPKGAGANREIDSDGNPIAAGTSTTDIVNLASGEERLDIDLGLYNPTAPLGQLGDRVWFDSNNNGVQDGTEQGVPGVSVSLLNTSNTVIATTVTDANGNYRFVNLTDATYSVKFGNLPAGFVFSPKDLGGNDNTDSDADPVTGQTGTYTITGGNTNLTVDAGIYSTRAALGDYVWFDADSDGTQDAGEKGIAGVTVTLYDAANVAVTSAITDQNGRYFFSNLNPGTYTVGFSTIPTKLAFTLQDVVAAGDAADSDVDPATGKTSPVTLTAGQVNLTVDAGLKPVIPASLGDFVWHDLDRDGLQDAGEPGVPGVVATLYNAANQAIGSAITDGNGYYHISNVPPGTGYYVVFSNKPNPVESWTLQNVGGTGASDNSKANATGQTLPINVAEGQNITNVDAGLFRILNLSGNVWHDVNGMLDSLVNNTRGDTAAVIPAGLKMILVDANTSLVVRTTLVQGNGFYNFPNIDPGTYILVLKVEGANISDPSPFASIPDGWRNTGERLGLNLQKLLPLNDGGAAGTGNGKLTVSVINVSVTNANFGINFGGDFPIN